MNRYPLPALLIIIVTAVLLALFVWYVALADNGRLSPPEWPTATPAANNAGPKPTRTPGGYPGPDPYPAPYPGPSVYLPVQLESYP